MSFDQILLTVTLLSGLACLGYALFRADNEAEKSKAAKFWLEVFTISALILTVRVFYLIFPTVTPDKFFFICTVLTGCAYLIFKLLRRRAPAEKRKVVKLYRDAFLCLLAVFLFRGFFYDWFRIPSNSMLPTLTVGDLVLVDKNRYGYRLPLLNTPISQGAAPMRGDVIVFQKPEAELFYIKRLIALPGDTIRYNDDKSVFINGDALPLSVESVAASGRQTLREDIDGRWHHLVHDNSSNVLFIPPDSEHCRLNQSSLSYVLTCTVPPGHYFVLGDNRDHSNDSRRWGFVPEANVVGPASRIIFNHRLLTDVDGSQLGRLWLSLALREE